MVFRVIILLVGLAVCNEIKAQHSPKPIKWHCTAVRLHENEARLIFTVTLDAGWYIYSQYIRKEGSMPTTFTFKPNKMYALKGKVREEGNPLRGPDNFFGTDLVRYVNSAVFSQDITMIGPATTVKGMIVFAACSNDYCLLLPDEIEFALEVKGKRADM